MKKITFFVLFFLICLSGYAQESNRETDFFIGKLEINPTLSFLASKPEFEPKLTLIPVDFSKKIEKPKLNMIAVMEAERRYQNRKVEFETPVWVAKEDKNSVLQISKNIGIHGDNVNYNPYTGKTKNAAFEEARPDSFQNRYSPFSPFSRGRYYRPYYSPFLR